MTVDVYKRQNRYSVVSIGVDTTNPDLLKLAIDLQATIFNLGGARPPIENIGPRVPPGSTNLMWRMIYFVQDLRSMGEQPLYTCLLYTSTKECPYCYSSINVKAVKCPNCTSDLITSD